MTGTQDTLFALEPAQVGATCRLGQSLGSKLPCRRPAVGTVPDWRAPLDPTLATPACEDCAVLYRVELDRWLT